MCGVRCSSAFPTARHVACCLITGSRLFFFMHIASNGCMTRHFFYKKKVVALVPMGSVAPSGLAPSMSDRKIISIATVAKMTPIW